MNKLILTRVLVVTVLVLAIIAGAYWTWGRGNGAEAKYRLAKVESGPLTAMVSATGTLNPVVSVQVGSQVSGQIKELFVDFNSNVIKGQLIARIDPETYQHRLRQAQADLEAVYAGLAVQQAEVSRAAANLAEAERDFERKKMLVEKSFISPAERDKAQNVLDTSHAQMRVAQSQAKNAEAMVKQRQAQLSQAQVDLERTAIRAPVDGIVVKRSVEPGQTVAASLQAPELFVIAKNLSDMQVETSIDEADVGRVRAGQKANFTVDAFPGRAFEGKVMQVRKAAQVVSNVVTYTVVVSAANPDFILLPGMTANVKLITAQKEKVLKVPNAALRFKPAVGVEEKATNKGARERGSRVWMMDENNQPKALVLRPGLSDGNMTEVLEGDLAEGAEVIVGYVTPSSKSAAPTGPPRLF